MGGVIEKIRKRDGTIVDFDKNKIRKFCFQHLAIYKVPKEFHYVAKLDKTASGKLKRWQL